MRWELLYVDLAVGVNGKHPLRWWIDGDVFLNQQVTHLVITWSHEQPLICLITSDGRNPLAVCVCVCIYIYIYIYMCVCVCVCVCAWCHRNSFTIPKHHTFHHDISCVSSISRGCSDIERNEIKCHSSIKTIIRSKTWWSYVGCINRTRSIDWETIWDIYTVYWRYLTPYKLLVYYVYIQGQTFSLNCLFLFCQILIYGPKR